MADLFLMSGIPGAGKSTFLKNRVKKDTSVVISRDVIRFSIVKPEEDYFSHENEVLAIFWKQINEALAVGKNVFVDQTSLTPKARKWLLQHVEGYDHANLIWIDKQENGCFSMLKVMTMQISSGLMKIFRLVLKEMRSGVGLVLMCQEASSAA